MLRCVRTGINTRWRTAAEVGDGLVPAYCAGGDFFLRWMGQGGRPDFVRDQGQEL